MCRCHVFELLVLPLEVLSAVETKVPGYFDKIREDVARPQCAARLGNTFVQLLYLGMP